MNQYPLLACAVLLSFFTPVARATIYYNTDGQTPPLSTADLSGDIARTSEGLRVRCLDTAGASKERAEFTTQNGITNNVTRFIGFRCKLSLPTPNDTQWCNIFQHKAKGAWTINVPFFIRADSGSLYLMGDSTVFWSRALPLDTWFTIIMEVKYRSDATGYVKLWYDGAYQGQFNMQTWGGDVNDDIHFGIYRRGGIQGTATNLVSRLKVASSYAEANPADQPGTYVRIMNRHSGKALNVDGASLADGAPVIQWSYTSPSPTNDEWQVMDVGGGFVRIMNRNSGKALNVSGGSLNDGAAIIQWPYSADSNTNDEWQIVDIGNGFVRIMNRKSGKALNVEAASTVDGARAIQWTYTSTNPANDEWQMVSVP